MKAFTWQGSRDARIDDVPDPIIKEPTDAIIKITSTGLCGSDLHLYEVLGPFLEPGDVLGHEPMGIVEEVGREVTHIAPGDRVVIPFNISCGNCFMCGQGLHSQCETTQVREQGMGAALFGYTKLYGQVPGAQAEYLRVPQAQFGPIKVPEGPADDRFLLLSDVLPTASQKMTKPLPSALAEKLMETAGVDRLAAKYTAIDVVRRGGTISLCGVYGGMARMRRAANHAPPCPPRRSLRPVLVRRSGRGSGRQVRPHCHRQSRLRSREPAPAIGNLGVLHCLPKVVFTP